jgi:hypothetical protein
MRTTFSIFACATICAASFACGSSSTNSGAPGGGGGVDAGGPAADNDAGTTDAAVDAAPVLDHGTPSTTYPAFTPAFGQLQNAGHVLKNPVIVAITWNGEASQTTLESFVDTIGATDYWKATTAEYGVGPAKSGATNHVHMTTAAPAQLTDADIQALVTANAGKTAGWPAPTPDTIYAFFLPTATSLQIQAGPGAAQDACKTGVGGYHDEVKVGTDAVSYAVVPACNFGGGHTVAEYVTLSMSHELIEAATDPTPNSSPGLKGFKDDGFAWDYFQEFQNENGDACEFFRASTFENKETAPAPFDFWVQRTWSNLAGAAAHDPCVPAAPGAYFNVTPLALEGVSATVPGQLTGGATQKLATKGIHVAPGKTVTFPIGFYSDAAMDPWTISVAAGNPVLAASAGGSQIDKYNQSSLTVTVDKTTGQNGEKAYVTVEVKTGGSLFQGEIITVSSKSGTTTHFMPIWIASEQ